jgi:hypothetical protein
MTDSQASATRKKALLVFGLVVAVIFIAVLALRGGDGDLKKGSGGDTSSAQGGSGASTGERPATTDTGSNALPSNDPQANPAGSPGGAAAGPSHSADGVTSGAAVDMTQLLLEAKVVDAARAALVAGDPKKALKELEFYDKIPNASSLQQEATILKIQALTQVGRKTDARALAYSTRDEPSFKPYQARIDAVLADAGMR